MQKKPGGLHLHEVESHAGLVPQDPGIVTSGDHERIPWTEIYLRPVSCTDTHPT